MSTITQDKVIDDTFVVHKILGQGFTSEVVLAEHRDTGYKLAIKMFKPLKDMKMMVESFRKEVDSMKNFKHPNLINIIAANENGVYVKPGKPKEYIMYLGIELAENAELFDFIADPGYGFKEPMARALFKQLIAGLKSMHDIKIAHRDLKTENLFLDTNFNLKVGDFGFSKFMDQNQNEGKLKTQLGTSGYQCPELVEKQLYSGEANDIFACGVILFILVNAYPPFREAKKTDNWYRHIYYDKIDNFWAIHSKKINISKELKELISGMLSYKNRWDMDQIINCDWLKGTLPTHEDYMADMKARKVKVDERRERERLEKLEVEIGDGGSSIYRGENEELMIAKLYKDLEENQAESFPQLKLERDLPKHYLRYNGTEVLEAFKSLVATLVNEGGNVTLDNDKFSLTCEIPFTSEEIPLDDKNNKYDYDEKVKVEEPTVGFVANAYVDENSKSVIIDLIRDGQSDFFEFTKFINFITNKALKN